MYLHDLRIAVHGLSDSQTTLNPINQSVQIVLETHTHSLVLRLYSSSESRGKS